MIYFWKQPQWPLFTYSHAEIEDALHAFEVQMRSNYGVTAVSAG
jgi:hypothetical protein